MQIIEDAVRDNVPLAQAIEELRRARPSRFAALFASLHPSVARPSRHGADAALDAGTGKGARQNHQH
jgi:hypothetical protein